MLVCSALLKAREDEASLEVSEPWIRETVSFSAINGSMRLVDVRQALVVVCQGLTFQHTSCARLREQPSAQDPSQAHCG